MQIRKITASALLIALGVLSAHLIYIPAGVAKCFPVQHAINVLAAVILGPRFAVTIAFVIACLRNMLGTGSIMAFPGGMLGAALAGLAYQKTKRITLAMAGEVFGTGILGGLTAWVIAKCLLGSNAVAWFFIPPFLVSTLGGSLIAGLLLRTGLLQHIAPLDKGAK